VVNGNSFTNITNYLDWQGSGTLDASANWWDTNSRNARRRQEERERGLHALAPQGGRHERRSRFQGDYSVLDVDDDSPQTGSVDRFAKRFALSSGSTINLMAGTYTNSAQVVIGKDIAMVGAGSGSTTNQQVVSTPVRAGMPAAGSSWTRGSTSTLERGHDGRLGKLVFQGSATRVKARWTTSFSLTSSTNRGGPAYNGVASLRWARVPCT